MGDEPVRTSPGRSQPGPGDQATGSWMEVEVAVEWSRRVITSDSTPPQPLPIEGRGLSARIMRSPPSRGRAIEAGRWIFPPTPPGLSHEGADLLRRGDGPCPTAAE